MQDNLVSEFTKASLEKIESEKKKISVLKLNKRKQNKKPVAWVTAYDLPFAYVAEKAGIDMILVGDSGGMVQLGYKSTNPVTMDEMITFAKSSRRGAPNTFLIGDMPQGSYEPSSSRAIDNAMRFVKEADCDAIKLEGGKRIINQVKALVDAGILVMGHLGLTPQSASTFGGYTIQGKTSDSFEKILEDALELEKAGIFALLLEAMPSEPAGQIAKQLNIPVYGIGAGNMVDGQLVIMHDLMGFYQPFRPWFAKCYIPEVAEDFSNYLKSLSDIRKVGREYRRDGLLVLAEMAVIKYIDDVLTRKFPGLDSKEDYIYPISKIHLSELMKSDKWK